MTKKIPKRIVNMGKVVKALRNRRMRNTDLQKELGIPEKSLNRILKYLRHMCLAKKEEKRLGRWYWYEEIKVYASKSQFELFREHTNDLLPALWTLMTYDFEDFWLDPEVVRKRLETFPPHLDEKSRVPFAEEHLRTGYPEIYDQLIELRKVKQKEDETKRTLVKRIEKEIEFALRELEPDERKWDRSHIRQSIHDALDGSRQELYLRNFVLEVEKQDFFGDDELIERSNRPDYNENTFDLRSKEYATHIENFQRLCEKGEELYRELAGNIASLLMKSRKEPLKGTCRMCPRVIIGNFEQILKDLQYVLKRIDKEDTSDAKNGIREVMMRLVRMSK